MLGRALVRETRRRGWPTLAPARAQADLCDLGRVLAVARGFAPNLIVNCAAFTKVDDCETQPEIAFAVNATAIASAVAAADEFGALLVHVSSDYVFDGSSRDLWREDDPTGPLSVYGASKLAGEQVALTAREALVVRTSWLFGPGGPSFPATMMRLVREGRVPLKVVDDQIGRPTFTPFLARAIADLAVAGARGIVHYGNRPAVSWYEFAQAIVEWTTPGTDVLPVATSAFPRPARRPAHSTLDVARFEALVGRGVEPWALGLARFLDPLAGDSP
jgi:dTDP-4-dehydrorhamnose reductase